MPLRPRPPNSPDEHGAQGLGVPERHPDVADDDHPDAQGQPVVDEGSPGAHAQWPGVIPAHDHTGPEHDQTGPRDEGGVELLAGVEFPDPQSAQPAAPLGSGPEHRP